MIKEDSAIKEIFTLAIQNHKKNKFTLAIDLYKKILNIKTEIVHA